MIPLASAVHREAAHGDYNKLQPGLCLCPKEM